MVVAAVKMASVNAASMMAHDTYMVRNKALAKRLGHELTHLPDGSTAYLMPDARVTSDYRVSGYALRVPQSTPAIDVIGSCSELNTVIAGVHIQKPNGQKREKIGEEIGAILADIARDDDFLDFGSVDSEALIHALYDKQEVRGGSLEEKINRFLVETAVSLGSGADTIRRPHLFVGRRKADTDEYVIYVRTYDVVGQAVMSNWLIHNPRAPVSAATLIMGKLRDVALAKVRILLYRVLAELARRVEGSTSAPGPEKISTAYAPAQSVALAGFSVSVPYAIETVVSYANCLWQCEETGDVTFYNDCICMPLARGGLPVWGGSEYGYATFFVQNTEKAINIYGDALGMMAPEAAAMPSAFPMETPVNHWDWPGSHVDLGPSDDMKFSNPSTATFMELVLDMVAGRSVQTTYLRKLALYEASGANYVPSLLEDYIEHTRDLDSVPPVEPNTAYRSYAAHPHMALMTAANTVVLRGNDPYGRLSVAKFYHLFYTPELRRAAVNIPGTTLAVLLQEYHENLLAHARGEEPIDNDLRRLLGRHAPAVYARSPMPSNGSNKIVASFASKIVA